MDRLNESFLLIGWAKTSKKVNVCSFSIFLPRNLQSDCGIKRCLTQVNLFSNWLKKYQVDSSSSIIALQMQFWLELYYKYIQMSRITAKVAPAQILPQKAVSQQIDFNHSQASIVSTSTKKKHFSQYLKRSITTQVHKEHSTKGTKTSLEQEESQLTQIVRTKIKQLRRISTCEICSSKFKRSQINLCDCEHRHNFCQSCLYFYAIYKIKQFEELYCPAEDCGKTVDTSGLFFKQMPLNLQNTYHKIHKFTVAAKDPSVVKLCPNQKCEGFITLKGTEGLFCSSCLKEYCTKCYLERHQGQCEENQVNYFQNNLHYRQCKRCKIIVQRTKGCNHMTCKCKFQFCYICGQKWSRSHSKAHQGNNLQPEPQQRIHHHSFIIELIECCIAPCCHQGTCLSFANSYVGIFLKGILKLLVILVQTILVLLQFLFKEIPFLLWLTVCTLLIGLCFSSFQVIGESDLLRGILLVLFFPIAMFMGIMRSFSEVFEPAIHQFYNETIDGIIDTFRDIINF